MKRLATQQSRFVEKKNAVSGGLVSTIARSVSFDHDSIAAWADDSAPGVGAGPANTTENRTLNHETTRDGHIRQVELYTVRASARSCKGALEALSGRVHAMASSHLLFSFRSGHGSSICDNPIHAATAVTLN